jgi:hypothetical protein
MARRIEPSDWANEVEAHLAVAEAPRPARGVFPDWRGERWSGWRSNTSRRDRSEFGRAAQPGRTGCVAPLLGLPPRPRGLILTVILGTSCAYLPVPGA